MLAPLALFLPLSLASAVAAQEPPSIPPESSVPTFVTSDDDPATRDYWASFSPDGESILFSRTRRRGGKWNLFVVPAEGGEARPLAKSPLPISSTRANWSASGGIAFAGASRDRRQQIWRIDANGSNARAVEASGLPPRVSYPSWDPGGESLVVIDGSRHALLRIDLTAGESSLITDPEEVLSGMPSVSPDGSMVAFAGQANVGEEYDQSKNSIYLLSEAGVRSVEPEPKQGRTPSWSPDGSLIAFESNRGSPNGRSYAVFVMDSEGENLRRLTPYSWNANHPMWSPDGRRMVFTARHPERRGTSGIAVLDLDLSGEPAEESERDGKGGKAPRAGK